MKTFRDIASVPWAPIRPDVASGVEGRTLLAGATRVVLTRVRPGGRFAPHRDAYGHLFHFLEGRGTVQVSDETRPAVPGLVVHVSAGELHGYANTGEEELILLSLNLPDT